MVIDDIGQRLSEAAEAREQRAREAIREAVGPGVKRLAEAYLPVEPVRAFRLAQDIAELCWIAARAACTQLDQLRTAGPRRALLLDGKGGRAVVPNPAAPALDVDRVLEAGRRVVEMVEDLDEPIPGSLTSAIMDLERAIGGRS